MADLGILIGEPDDRGHGIGTTAIRIAERDAFESWGIGKVRLRVRASNSSAIGCYEQSGFTPVNKSTKAIEGEVVDVIHMEHELTTGETSRGEQGVAPNRSLAPTLNSTSSVSGSED